MDDRLARRRGRYTVVCHTFEASNGRFSPRFQIYEGEDINGKPIHAQDFPAPGPDFATREEAHDRAALMADEWLTANRNF